MLSSIVLFCVGTQAMFRGGCSFNVEDKVRHKFYGDGRVTGIVSPTIVTVRFNLVDGERRKEFTLDTSCLERRQTDTEEDSQESHMEDAFSPEESYSVGDIVSARWTKKKWYQATITQGKDGDEEGTYRVIFSNGKVNKDPYGVDRIRRSWIDTTNSTGKSTGKNIYMENKDKDSTEMKSMLNPM